MGKNDDFYKSDEEIKEENSAGGDNSGVKPDENNNFEENIEVADDLNEKLKKAESEVAELKDSLLRKHADFENFRKRVIREKEETIKYGNTNLLLDLVDIIDDFERAINSAKDSKDFQQFHQGVQMIEKQFSSMLEKKWNLARMDSAGEKFDPEKHEALMMEEKEGVEEPIVAEVYQNGYMLNGRVIRHAKVKVSMPKNASKNTDEA